MLLPKSWLQGGSWSPPGGPEPQSCESPLSAWVSQACSIPWPAAWPRHLCPSPWAVLGVPVLLGTNVALSRGLRVCVPLPCVPFELEDLLTLPGGLSGR